MLHIALYIASLYNCVDESAARYKVGRVMPPAPLCARLRFARSLKAFRIARGLSGDALARLAEVGRNTPLNIEKGASNVLLETIARFSAALQVDPCAFLTEAEFPAPTDERLNKLRVDLAANVKTIRAMRGLSQDTLTERARLHRGYVWQLESAQTNPSLDSLEKIAGVLDVNVWQLLAPRPLPAMADGQTEKL
jgi:transcriptional regulator with XRE-family HTH domain